MAVTTEKDSEKQSGDNRTMGRKATVLYGLYLTHGFISPNLANQTGFNTDDQQLFFDALTKMFDHDRSAARGLMSARKIFVFRHDSELGNAPASQLFDLIKVNRKESVNAPRSFSDYEIVVDIDNLPKGVTLEELL